MMAVVVVTDPIVRMVVFVVIVVVRHGIYLVSLGKRESTRKR